MCLYFIRQFVKITMSRSFREHLSTLASAYRTDSYLLDAWFIFIIFSLAFVCICYKRYEGAKVTLAVQWAERWEMRCFRAITSFSMFGQISHRRTECADLNLCVCDVYCSVQHLRLEMKPCFCRSCLNFWKIYSTSPVVLMLIAIEKRNTSTHTHSQTPW